MQIFTEEKSRRKWDRNISFFKSSYYNNHIKYRTDYFTYFCISRIFHKCSNIYIFYINEITNFEFSGKWNKTDAAVKISRVCREKQSFVNCHRDRWCKSSFKRGAKSKKSRPRKRRNKKKKKKKTRSRRAIRNELK